MRKIVLLSILFSAFQTFAEEPINELFTTYQVDSVAINENLEEGMAVVKVRITNDSFTAGDKILYGYNELSLEAYLDEKKSFEFSMNSGDHVFQFYPPEKIGFAEITTEPIQINSKTTTFLSINFHQTVEIIYEVRKPVIYLYPEQETSVSVSVESKGEMSFMYPQYTDKWECTAFPSGELFVDGKSYNYLFWEAEQKIESEKLNEGTLVSKEILIAFLENSLDRFAFNSKEKMDFITYWAPQMLKFETTDIRFVFNEDCTQFADLKIDPVPDHLIRFYMIWKPVHRKYKGTSKLPAIPASDRSGFTVLEWGGMEMTVQKNHHIAEN